MVSAVHVGTENLEVMEEARNYNAALLTLAQWAVRPGEGGVDFGAGHGTFALPMTEFGCRIACVESDEASLTMLRTHGLAVHRTLTELPAKSFDGAWSFNVLEHIEDDAAALFELRRVLRPDGRLALYVPAFPILYSAMDRLVGHLRRYRREGLVALVKQCGFDVERAYYADCLGFPAALAYRFLGNSNGHLSASSVRRYDRLVFPASHALDGLFRGVIGKNVVIEARRNS